MFAENRRYSVAELWGAVVVDEDGRSLGPVHAVGFGRDSRATKVAVAEGETRLRFLSLEGARLEPGKLRVRQSVPV
ncbi:MAG TPA: hypothetical protein VFA92_15420 [Candidatus Binatia bacterium]|jgi:hypothetical protein|nr:hypothetical protein [Candidatus Binatia bacterium]